MLVKIVCPQCGQEKELEVKVPKYCGNECRLANFKASRIKKVVEPVIETPIDGNIQPEVTTTDSVVPPQEATGDTPVQQ